MELFYILLVLLIVTRSFGELAVRLGQPALIGELFGGIALGMLATRFSAALPILAELGHNEVFHAITELGVFFLMLLAGLEMHPKELRKASLGAFGVALGGLLLPLGAGCALGWIYLPESEWKFAQTLFLGITM